MNRRGAEKWVMWVIIGLIFLVIAILFTNLILGDAVVKPLIARIKGALL